MRRVECCPTCGRPVGGVTVVQHGRRGSRVFDPSTKGGATQRALLAGWSADRIVRLLTTKHGLDERTARREVTWYRHYLRKHGLLAGPQQQPAKAAPARKTTSGSS